MSPRRHRARRRLRSAHGLGPAAALPVAALLAAAALAGCGGSGSSARTGTSHTGTSHTGTARTGTSPSPSPATLGVRPAHPLTNSTITFSFTAPVASGVHGTHVITYSLSVTGAARPGCVGAHEANSPAVARGQTAQIALGPSQLGGPWCPGRYTARVLELQSAHCTGNTPCPQYIRVVGAVARGAFTVTR